VPNVGEPNEVPNVGEPNEVPNVGEPNKVTNLGDQNKVPNVADQTEIPNDVEHSDGSEESDDRPNEVPVEDTQPVEAEVFEDLDLEDFDSASDPDDGMVSRLAVENRRQLWLSKNDKVRVRAQCKGIVPTFSNDDGSHFGPNGPSDSSGLSGSTGLSGKSKLEKTKMADSQSSGKPKVVLNRQLLDGRDKPIITCLEFIRQYLMKRIVIVQQLINKSSGPITPNATKIFNNIKKEAAQSSVLWNGGDLYQATSPHGT
ncbi:hypothetical protein Tco_1037044, partial [Tanacetum coccineum]